MDAQQAKVDIAWIFSNFHALSASDRSHLARLASQTPGKLYELWVLSQLVQEIATCGYNLAFTGSRLKFKGAPGYLKLSDPHFTINHPSLMPNQYRIFVNVEFTTLSASHPSSYNSDLSDYYEADIIVTRSMAQRPTPQETAIVVECKAHANLSKGVIREVLGTRRELSLLSKPKRCVLPDMSSGFARHRRIPASPPVQLRLVTTDPNAAKYLNGPSHYGVEVIINCP